jgi:hypothetical protein
MEFTVFALFYGDHPELAQRCLDSLRGLPYTTAELRIGLNAVPDTSKTQDIVRSMVEDRHLDASNVYESTENIYKYPMMRRMFHDPDNPILTPHIMWFDDDSFFRTDEITRMDLWFSALSTHMEKASMLGAVYKLGLSGNQRAFIEDQEWYNDKPVGDSFTFITGGWWCLRADIVKEFDWPVADLAHRGGDTLLGELLRQHDHTLKHFTRNVAINADSDGNQCKAPRRGFDSPPVGHDYNANAPKQIAEVLPQLQKFKLTDCDKENDMADKKKAKLEVILEELTTAVETVGKEMDAFDLVRRMAIGEETATDGEELKPAVFSVDVGTGPIELPAPPELSKDLLESMMDAQGRKVTTTWTEVIKPLVDEAIDICQKATDPS